MLAHRHHTCASRSRDRRRIKYPLTIVKQLLGCRKQPVDRRTLAASVALWRASGRTNDGRRKSWQWQARQNGDLRLGMLQWPPAQRGLFHLRLTMRLEQRGDARIGGSRYLDAPACSDGICECSTFQDDPLVERRGIVGEERAGRANDLFKVWIIRLCQQYIEACVGVAAAQAAIMTNLYQWCSMAALSQRRAHRCFPLQRGDDERGLAGANTGGDGIVPALQALALKRRFGPVLADHLDDTNRAGKRGLFHPNRRVGDDGFEQALIGGAVEDDLGLIRTGELRDQMLQSEIEQQIAVACFDAAGKMLPDQALALLAIQQAQQRWELAWRQRLVVRERRVGWEL